MENKIGPQDNKGKKRLKKNKSAVSEPAAKKQKKNTSEDTAEPEFSHIRFKFLLRSPDTITEGLQRFLNISCKAEDDTDDDDVERLLLLEAYLKSSPQCSEVLDLLVSKLSPPQVSLVLTWIRHVLEECHKVTTSFGDLQLHLSKTLLTKHYSKIMNTIRRGSKSGCAKATLLLLVTMASLGHKYAKLLQLHLDFSHDNWLHLLTQRNRKDVTDVRACMTALLMKLLQVDDDELTRSLVDQKVLLQEVLSGMKYDQSEYVIANLKTIHRYVVLNKSVGKNAKLYLFNSQVLKEMLVLYQWLGSKHWKQQPTAQEKLEYSEEQKAVAEVVHTVLVDLLANHKMGICFRDKSMGLSTENKNRTVSKVLQLLVTSFTTPLSHCLVTDILSACPDQLHSFLVLLQPYLVPRPVDTWITSLQFFLKIMETVEWPSVVMEDIQAASEEKVSQLAHLLFPPDGIITALKDGLKHECATVRQLCLQALELIASHGQRFRDISRSKFGDTAPLSLCIEGITLKVLPNEQVQLNLLKRFSTKDNFSVPITRDLYKDTDVPLPHVSRFQHLVTILRMYSLAPEHLTGGLTETLPLLLQLVGQIGSSCNDEETDSLPEGVSGSLPALCLLQALSQCDVRKLTLFGKGGNKGDLTQTLVYQLVRLMQAQGNDQGCSHTAQSLIVKLLASTGLFEGHQRELSIWLHHLTDTDSAPQEVVTYFVSLLRQYIPNPYPAIDRLLEQVEEAPRLIDGQYLQYVRLEFSPLVMFAVSGDFHKHEKVHHYICNVLIDILHSLHNPCSFSRLVHSLASNLDPEVTLYLTFHTAQEEATMESIMKRASKKVRFKQLKSAGKHKGVSLLKKIMMCEAEVTAMVEMLSPSDCLSLVHQSLRYVDEAVAATMKNKGELLNKELVKVCMEILRIASLRLATGPIHHEAKGNNSKTSKADVTSQSGSSDSESDTDDNTERVKGKQSQGGTAKISENSDSSEDGVAIESDDDDENDDDEEANEKVSDETSISAVNTAREETEISASGRYCTALSRVLVTGDNSDLEDLSRLATNWFREVSLSILTHPLVTQWLFVEGFKQGGMPAEWIVRQLCDVIQGIIQLKDSSANQEGPVSYVSEKFREMIQAAASMSGSGRVPKKLQPLLCRCLETLTLVGGCSHKVEALLVLVNLPSESFLCMSTQKTTSLAHMLFRLADSVKMDAKAVKELNSRQAVSSSLEGLFHLIATLDSPQLESLALSCVRSTPQLSLACSKEAFEGLLNKLGAEVSTDMQALVETLMADNPQCHRLCGSWLKKKKKEMKNRKLEFAPVMLMYLHLALTTNDAAVKDIGVCAITEAVRHSLDNQAFNVNEVNASFLHVVCHLVNCNMIDLTTMQKLQSSIMVLADRNSGLLEAHVQLLAAILRQQALYACGLGSDADALDSDTVGKKWSTFEEQAGKMLVGCLRCLVSEQMTKEDENSGLRAKLVILCQDLLSLPTHQKTKHYIIQFWPSLVSSCLKYHFKDATYVALLRHLVQSICVEAENQLEKNEDTADDIITDSAAYNDGFNTSRKVSDISDKEDNKDESHPTKQKAVSRTKLHSSASEKLASRQPAKHFSAIVAETAKRLGLTKTSDVNRKCQTLFGDDGDNGSFASSTSDVTVTPARAEVVNSWTRQGSLWCRSFFPWPKQGTLPASYTQKLSSHGALLLDLCETCVGHTAFLSIMLDGEWGAVKGELVNLLACLVRLEQKCCSALPLNTLLAAYGATLSLTDQNLLYLMLSCDLHGKQRLKPGLWGEKAVQRLEMKQQMGKSLLYETSLNNILELIDPDMMTASILNFPLMRTMEYQPMECAVKAERMMSEDGCYDPRFLLQIFFHFMGPEHIVDVRAFMAHRGLGYTLAALSSHDTLTRQLAVGVLSNLHSHIELISRWSSAPILLAFLKVIMNSMTLEGQKLPSVVTIFLAKAAELFVTPGDDMYVPIYSFINLKAGMDIGNVPEFYQFFNSPNPKERLWMLQLLQDGLRETSDHAVFQRRYVYKLVMCYTNSSLSDHQTRRESLKVLLKASSIATVAKYLVTKRALLAWLVSFIKDTLLDSAEATKLVCQLLHNLCYTTEFSSRRLWWLSLTRLSRQCLLHVPLRACVRLLLLNFSHLEVNSLEMLLDVLQHPHLTPTSCSTLLPLVILITWHLARHGVDMERINTAAFLAQSLGFNLPTVTSVKPQQQKDTPVAEEGKDTESETGKKKAEKMSELRQRALCLLSAMDDQDWPMPVIGDKEESAELSVEDMMDKLHLCLRR